MSAVIAGVLLSFVITSADPTPWMRSAAAIAAFRKETACPSTGNFTGPCPGYVIDHKYPLCAGGADTPENMMWQEIAQSYVKDRIERELCALKVKCPR